MQAAGRSRVSAIFRVHASTSPSTHVVSSAQRMNNRASTRSCSNKHIPCNQLLLPCAFSSINISDRPLQCCGYERVRSIHVLPPNPVEPATQNYVSIFSLRPTAEQSSSYCRTTFTARSWQVAQNHEKGPACTGTQFREIPFLAFLEDDSYGRSGRGSRSIHKWKSINKDRINKQAQR